MFEDYKGDSINIFPIQENIKSCQDFAGQTLELRGKDANLQTTESSEIKVQTDPPSSVSRRLDAAALRDFLPRALSLVIPALESNTRAFDIYKFLPTETPQHAEKIQAFEIPDIEEEELLAMDWNSSGTILALSVGQSKHEGWCLHTSRVILWSPGEPGPPQLEVDSCVTCLRFHPSLPSLLLMGKFNGEVVLLDIGKKGSLAPSVLQEERHLDAITAVAWLRDGAHHPHKILTASMDGKILMWSYNQTTKKTRLADGFVVLAKHLEPALPTRKMKQDGEVGVVTAAFSPSDPAIFVVGTLGGGIFQCTLDSEIPANYKLESRILYKSPISMGHTPHAGKVASLDFSPASGRLFLSAGTDGNVFIFALKKTSPLKVIRLEAEMISARWCPWRSLAVVVGSGEKLEFYQLEREGDAASVGEAGLLVAFNPAHEDLLATSGPRHVTLLKLSPQLLRDSTSKEINFLEATDSFIQAAVEPINLHPTPPPEEEPPELPSVSLPPELPSVSLPPELPLKIDPFLLSRPLDSN